MSKPNTNMILDASIYTSKIPKDVRSAMSAFTGSDCLLVKHRQHGKTGSGKILNCHDNVKNWVEKFGGEQIYGWVLHRQKRLLNIGAYIWNFHSIWKTPENKLADVTMNPIYDDSEYITFWPDTNRVFDWSNMISYNMIEVYENSKIADSVSRNVNYPIDSGRVYWANNGVYMPLEEDDGTYKLMNEARKLEIAAHYGIQFVKEGDKTTLVGSDKLSMEQHKELRMKYSLSM